MSSMNRVFLMGNLTRDPELKRLPNGDAVTDLAVAVNETYRNRSGETVEKTCFADVVVWGRTAENCEQYLSKGSPLLVEGGLQLDQWETNDGQKRSKLRIRARRVQFLWSPRSNGSRTPQPAAVANATPESDDAPPF